MHWGDVKQTRFLYRPYLTVGKREALADYALPVAVLVMSFTGSYCFRDIPSKTCSLNRLQTISDACQKRDPSRLRHACSSYRYVVHWRILLP